MAFRPVASGIVALFLASPDAIAQQASPLERSDTCVDVQIGGDRSAYLDCLNAALARSVERERRAPPPEAPIDARSPANRTGIFTESAARQRMGNAFGVSAQPQRPDRVYVSPLTPQRSR